MTTAMPGDGSYEEALRRVAAIIEQNQQDLADIDRTSEISFRLWLDKVIQQVSAAIGVTLGKAQAFVADVMTSVANAAGTYIDAYRTAYRQSRRIERR
jgi:hypothetical protein